MDEFLNDILDCYNSTMKTDKKDVEEVLDEIEEIVEGGDKQ